MARLDNLTRTLRVLGALAHARGGATAAQLARGVDASPRTIYRDLATLERAGYALLNERDGRSVLWRLADPGTLSTRLDLSIEELCALDATRDIVHFVADPMLGPAADSAFEKVSRAIAPPARHLLDAHRDLLSIRTFGERDYRDCADLLREIRRAILERTWLRIVYGPTQRGAVTPRRLAPYCIFSEGGALYLVAYDERRQSLRTFAVHRVQRYWRDAETFERDPSFRLRDYMRDSFRLMRGDTLQDIVVRLSPQGARLAEGRRFHSSQTQHALPSGGLELRLRVSALEEVCAWILGFQGEAVPLSPPALKDMVALAVRRLADQLATTPAAGGSRPTLARTRQSVGQTSSTRRKKRSPTEA